MSNSSEKWFGFSKKYDSYQNDRGGGLGKHNTAPKQFYKSKKKWNKENLFGMDKKMASHKELHRIKEN